VYSQTCFISLWMSVGCSVLILKDPQLASYPFSAWTEDMTTFPSD